MPAKKTGITHGDGKTGPFPLWVVAELLLAVLVKYITSLVLSKSFLQLSFKQYLYLPIRIRGFGDIEQQSLVGKECLSIICWLVQREGKIRKNGRGGSERRKNCVFIGSVGRMEAFQSCCRYLMKAQATTLVRDNTGTSTMAMGIPLSSASP